jgi:lysophospholipid acyltransferase (LPLAT)-like uncharacterized protein
MKKSLKKRFRRFFRFLYGWGVVQWLLAIVYYVLIWFVYFTSKKDISGYDILKKYRKNPAIFVFWHGRSMMLSPVIALARVRGYAIADPRRDGRAIARMERLFGLKTIYGSSDRGGVSVLKKGISVLNAGGNCLALSPDGPVGPSMRFHDGALYFAKMTGAPIIPVCYSCSRPWFLNRWDRYLLTKPFSVIAGTVGKPIFIDRKTKIEDFEKIRKNLEDIMVKQAYDLDKRFTDFRVEQDLSAENFEKIGKKIK